MVCAITPRTSTCNFSTTVGLQDYFCYVNHEYKIEKIHSIERKWKIIHKLEKVMLQMVVHTIMEKMEMTGQEKGMPTY